MPLSRKKSVPLRRFRKKRIMIRTPFVRTGIPGGSSPLFRPAIYLLLTLAFYAALSAAGPHLGNPASAPVRHPAPAIHRRHAAGAARLVPAQKTVGAALDRAGRPLPALERLVLPELRQRHAAALVPDGAQPRRPRSEHPQFDPAPGPLDRAFLGLLRRLLSVPEPIRFQRGGEAVPHRVVRGLPAVHRRRRRAAVPPRPQQFQPSLALFPERAHGRLPRIRTDKLLDLRNRLLAGLLG